MCGSLLGQALCVTLSLCEGCARPRVCQSLCKCVERGWDEQCPREWVAPGQGLCWGSPEWTVHVGLPAPWHPRQVCAHPSSDLSKGSYTATEVL